MKFGHETSDVSLSIAVKTEEGKVFVESIDCREERDGVAWILDFIERSKPKKVAVDGASGSGILADAMKQERLKPPVIPKVADIIKANALLEQKIADGSIQHMDQPALRQVVSNCERRNIGSNGGYGYRSQLDGASITLLDSVILAEWLCVSDKEVKKQRVRY